jgi:putative addiction module killer protein
VDRGNRGISDRLEPGYRIYLGKDRDTLIVLLGGGTKKRQQSDIERAQTMWTEYRRRKADAAKSKKQG